MINKSIYEEIGIRSGGDIYVGVVGPVRTGKSTFIRRFMDIMVIPAISDQYEKTRVTDELPQSGEGRTITTTEPKFIPPDSVLVSTQSGANLKVRLVDCVGYMVPGVLETGKTARREWCPHRGRRKRSLLHRQQSLGLKR